MAICLPSSQPKAIHLTKIRSRIRSMAGSEAGGVNRREDVVIVGAGIAGLASAVSLQRVGIGSVVLEQAESLRTGGTSITFFKNGWKVLDAIGVGSQLRSQYLEIQGMVVKSEDGRELRSFRFKDEDESQEVRAVERRMLLETLASQLPPNTISFSSKIKNIERGKKDETVLKLEDESQISAKIVIACDGTRSPMAKWMGFPDPNYVGHCAIRGIGFYPDGQLVEPKVNYVYGRGVRAGYLPISSTKVYWFLCFNSPSPEDLKICPSEVPIGISEVQAKCFVVQTRFPSYVVKNEVVPPFPATIHYTVPYVKIDVVLPFTATETNKLIQNWSSDLLDIIKSTPDDMFIRTPLVDRWLWPGISPPASIGNVVLAGDAWHPMTPNLGQGGCCALEDSIVLAKKLEQALKFKTISVEDAFKSYESIRWPRIFPLTVRANLVGAILQLDNPLVCSLRNNFILPKLVQLGPMLEHTNFEFEPL